MLVSPTSELDADEVYPGIWVGSVPRVRGGPLLKIFTHVVLCAEEFQFPAEEFTEHTIVHCPFEDEDTVMGAKTMAMVFSTARAVAEAQAAGGSILVTCAAGRNRSALVAALAMRMLGVEPWIAIEKIRARRSPQCLSNTCFQRIILGHNKASTFYLPTRKDGLENRKV
jgi:protein-tyrosine phosphatase